MSHNDVHIMFSAHSKNSPLTLNHLNTIRCANNLRSKQVLSTVGEFFTENSAAGKTSFPAFLISGSSITEKTIQSVLRDCKVDSYFKVYNDNKCEVVNCVSKVVTLVGSLALTTPDKATMKFNGKFFCIRGQ